MNSSTRKGSMLIQQVILMGISGMLMSVAVSLIHQSLTAASSYRARWNDQRAYAALLRQFRWDCHLAFSATCEDGKSCELRLVDGHRIFYRAQANKVTREMISFDASEIHSRETYRLNQNQSVLMATEGAEATLRMETSHKEDSSRIVAHRRVLIRARLLEYHVQAPLPPAGQKSTERVQNAEADQNG